MAAQGSPDVMLAWTMAANWYGSADRSNVIPISQLYPGDAYVDVVGLDQYTSSSNWLSLQEMFVRDYDEMVGLAGPEEQVWIAEVGATADTRKAEWIRTGFLTTIPNRFPEVSAIGYWDESPYNIDTSQASLDAYREVVGSSHYPGSLP
jgi:beta-mannanase